MGRECTCSHARCGLPCAPSHHPHALCDIFQNLPHEFAAGVCQVVRSLHNNGSPVSPDPKARPEVVREARSPHTLHAEIPSPPRLGMQDPCPGPALQSVSPSVLPLYLQGSEVGEVGGELGPSSSGGGSGFSGMPPPSVQWLWGVCPQLTVLTKCFCSLWGGGEVGSLV